MVIISFKPSEAASQQTLNFISLGNVFLGMMEMSWRNLSPCLCVPTSTVILFTINNKIT